MRSWQGDQRSIEAHVLPIFGAKALNDVTRAEVERWKVDLLEGRAPATVNRVFALLRHMFNQAVSWGHLKDSPCRGVRQFRADNTRVRFLRGQELARLLEAAGALADGAIVDGKTRRGYPWLRALITVAVNTGLRFGELVLRSRS
jgi:integrase